MSRGLEAITSPVSTELKNGKQFYTYTKEDVETIEKELKQTEELETMYSNCVIEGAKQKKALEIIKTDRDLCKFIIFRLEDNHTKEETELLKEELL